MKFYVTPKPTRRQPNPKIFNSKVNVFIYLQLPFIVLGVILILFGLHVI